ncbi:MAG: hypothetical protein CL910_14660 [Deltaproteobacteria bacterium]|jgi:2-polyprenyl-3-methyl-5-hydroxy-6-metoxy-1,4-benzoquinol methylase|nr:hypothetical protein [Deltaproteobacteria bacterium]
MSVEKASDGSSCRLCAAGGAEPLFEKEGVPYFRCASCSFVFSVPELNPNFCDALDEYDPTYLSYFGDMPEDEANSRYAFECMERHLPLAGVRLLDVGAGSGKWVRYLRARGVQAEGVEPSTALFEHFLAGSPEFHPVDLERFAAAHPGRRFDVVTAFDVLEHLDDPGAFLESAARLLSPGGWLFGATVDVDTWPCRLMGSRWHLYNRYHLAFWSRRTLARAASERGLLMRSMHRPWRYHSAGYLISYIGQYFLRSRRLAAPRLLDRVQIPFYLPDSLFASFERAPG